MHQSAFTSSDVGPDPGDLGDLSKAELYDLATELDVSGRSSMTKARLEKAQGSRKKAS